MAKVYAGVDSLRLSQVVGISGFVSDYRENTTVKFGTASFKPAGTGSGVFSSGALQRSAVLYNQSNSSTRKYRRTGFFTNPYGPQYAWDCWVYLNSANSGKSGATDTPSIFSWPVDNITNAGSFTGVALQLQVTASDEISLVITNSSNVTQQTLTTINASSFSETNFLGAWWWISFQRNGGNLDMWMGKSGTATNIYSATLTGGGYTQAVDDLYRIGCSGTPANNASSPIDGFIDEVAVRKGLPFSGTVSCPTGAYTGTEDGMVDLYHFDTTGNSFPSNAAGSINQTEGSNIGGTFNEYLQTFNPNATTTELNDSVFGIGYTAFKLGEVTVTAVVPPTVELTGVSGSTSLANTTGVVTPDQVIGVSLQTNTYNSIGPGISASTTVPFSGINSYDFTGVTPGSNAVYLPNFGRECWGFNDFTLEAFVRGDGTTAEGNILYLPFNEGGDIDEYGRRMLCGINSSNQIIIQNTFRSNTGFKRGVILIDIDTPDPSTWYHLAIVRKNNKLYVLWNGERVAYDIDSAGNGSFLDGGSISDIQGLGFLFGPFGGLDQNYPSSAKQFILGSAVSSFPNFNGYIANYRSSYIDQYNVTSSTYTVPTSAFTGAESGTAYYAKTFSGTGQNNAGTALPQAGINGLAVIEPKAAAELGSVSVVVLLDPVQVTGVSASTSLGDLVPDSEVIYAGVDSIRLSGSLGTGTSSDFRETTTVKFGTASFKPYGTGSGVNFGALQRQGINYNQSSKDTTRFFRQTGFFSGPDLPENTYAWDCWFYLNSSSAGNGTSDTPAIFSWEAKLNNTGNRNTFELRVTGDDELTLVKMRGATVLETVGTINAATFSETNFLGAWFWVGFQKEVSTIGGSPSFHRKMWMGKSGTAVKVIDSNTIDTYTSIAPDQYRIGATGTSGGTPQFTPIDGFIDEVAVRKGNPFSDTVTCPTVPYTGNEEGMLDLYHFDTQSLNSAGSVNSGNGISTINGFFDFYLQTFNPNATNTSFSETAGSRLNSITTEIGALGEADGFLLQAFEGDISAKTVLDPIVPTGQNLTTSLGPAAAGPGILVPSTGQNLTASLGIITLPTIWGYVTTGTTSTWTPVDTGKKAIGP